MIIDTLPKGRIPLLQRLFFKAFVKAPAGLIAEPFEIFLVIFGLLSSVSLLLEHFQHIDKMVLPYYHGVVGLLVFSGVLLVASVALLWSLATMVHKNLLSVRKLEIGGMWLYAAAFGYYAYANLSVGLSLPEAAIYPILAEGAFIVLVLACVIRAVSLSSPITALSVTRVNRVKQIQSELKQLLADDKAARA